MLVLTRKPGESIQLGDNVRITLVRVRGNQARIAIEAPMDVAIRREELQGAARSDREELVSLASA